METDGAKKFLFLGCAYAHLVEIAKREFDIHRDATGQDARAMSLVFPLAANSAFASEQFLKSIRCSENCGSYEKGHNLKSLFSSLSPQIQRKIAGAMRLSLPELETRLKDVGDAFEEARYLEVHKSHKNNNGSSKLRETSPVDVDFLCLFASIAQIQAKNLSV